MLQRELVRCDNVGKRSCARRLRWRWLQCGSGADDEQRLELCGEMRRDDSCGSEWNGDVCIRCIIGAGHHRSAQLRGSCSLLHLDVPVGFSRQ